MSKYKSGDTINYEGVLDQDAADFLNRGGAFSGFQSGQVIRHSPAPEPIVRYIVTSKNYGWQTLSEAQRNMRAYYGEGCQIIKTTFIGNDFTVEKVG